MPANHAPDLLLDILCTGALGALASAAAASTAAKAEGKGALQPLNATSHWLHGPRAGRVRELDAAHSGVGLATRPSGVASAFAGLALGLAGGALAARLLR
jgi:hypothetical protein